MNKQWDEQTMGEQTMGIEKKDKQWKYNETNNVQ